MIVETPSSIKTDFPPTARVWLYAANRELTKAEAAVLASEMKPFLAQWAAHGTALKAGGQLIDDQFLVVVADESVAAASGCSIDASTHFIGQLGAKFSVDFFDRSVFWIKSAEGKKAIPVAAAKKAISEGIISPDTLVYNPMVQTVEDLENRFLITAKNSWLKRFFG